MIVEVMGWWGLNFAVAFLRPDGCMQADTGFDVMLRHLDHLLAHSGKIELGSVQTLMALQCPMQSNAAGLPALRELRAHGYDNALMTKLCHANWVNVLAKYGRGNG